MCGITGFYNYHSTQCSEDHLIRKMLASISHRGPDEAGLYMSDQLTMGTARLSIIGVDTGQQPMADDQERYVLCYNGEVYNYIELKNELKELGYRFRTTSDTEVVLHSWCAWGPACLKRFNGAFAIAIYDRLEKVLFLARDRFGKRPLYYTKHKGSVYFGSEMKCFLAIDDFSFKFDSHQLSSILTLWTPLTNQSSFEGINQISQGCYAKLCGDEFLEIPYYQMDFSSDLEINSESSALEAIGNTLSNAVKLRLRSDVEVGVYLSGGLDSSILSSIMADQVEGKLRTYSVSFDDAEFDESADQKIMVKHLGSRHRTVTINDQSIVDNFSNALYHAEVPVFRTAFVPMYLLSEAVSNDGIKVVMTGEGADEMFLGYNIFKETLMRSQWNTLTEEEKVTQLQRLYPYLKHYGSTPASHLLGFYQQFSEERYKGLFSHEIRIQNGLFSSRILKDNSSVFNPINNLLQSNSYFSGLSAIHKAQWLEFHTLLSGYLLSSQGERMSLAHAVENRCPFLDPSVLELSTAINLKFDDGSTEKYLLRKAFSKDLPPGIIRKDKTPYRAPDTKAFINTQPDYLELLLSESEIRKIDVLDEKFCQRLTRKVLSTPVERISTKENQAFIYLLSLCVLNHQFVKKVSVGYSNFIQLERTLTKVIDERSPSAVSA